MEDVEDEDEEEEIWEREKDEEELFIVRKVTEHQFHITFCISLPKIRVYKKTRTLKLDQKFNISNARRIRTLKLKMESRNVLFQNYQVKERTGGSMWEYELAWGHTEAQEDQVVFLLLFFSFSFFSI